MRSVNPTAHPTAGPAASAPDWWRNAVIYQVYPRSFADADGDGTGDLAGVRDRLPYLAELGVDALWFTPWYRSPQADGGYDVADYRAIDPAFGTLADAEELISAAGELGIRTIVDVVPNHVSDQHAWFQEALAAAPGDPARDRFWFHDGRGLGGDEMPTRWTSSFAGDTWTRTTGPDGKPGQWYLHLFAPEQPDLNWNHPDVVAEHEAVLRFWYDRGVAGIRIDSAALIAKDPELPEVGEHHEPGRHPHLDRDELHDVYRGWRKVADSYEDPRILVGEVWLDDNERFVRYLRDDEMHMAFNFDFMSRPWDAEALAGSIRSTFAAHATVDAPPTWVLSNHDVTRPVTRYGREDSSFAFSAKRFGTPTDLGLGARRARAAALLTAALPGVLYIYQGDELGLPEVEDLPEGTRQDPMHFRSGGIDPGRDGCRVPLPWTATGPTCGFNATGTAPWLPQPEGWGAYAAASQQDDPDSFLALYRAAIRLRHTETALRGDAFAWTPAAPGTLAFRRGEDLVCVVNFGDAPADLPAHTAVLIASAPLEHGRLPQDAAVWLRT
ncbi:glycoside hydrolase family 13 protein [Glycomyces algeriensis]|uniref:Alpha-glucosidase n=1 Tax=Glycomyces algeriensis TaxID=256037 RepID=A0A9W6LGY2_9ACTN|nr:glycoside hydrolase family 13 protein [Glycomyces algeriensis]MDA1364731.1 glycoside hydrolase family 13 protein [Glycomyces algeriensis]MDR7350772.1 alpha-glucosidase [Glycomyces algeriensis]GLI43482.1 alpha-glucosidase [Glycomyces algeriensis]